MDDKCFAFGGQFFIRVSELADYYFYSYEHLDDLSFMQSAKEAFSIFTDADTYIAEISSLFMSKGWQGDGDIQLFWLPPFVAGTGDTDGIFCFHVKQQDNGTSWIASPVPLRFKGLNLLADYC